jgi:hypothetical protein
MSTFHGSPRLLKGAIIGVDPFNPLASAVVFQDNPDTLTRSLQVKGAGADSGDRSEALRLKGPPVETMRTATDIDATDLLTGGHHA